MVGRGKLSGIVSNIFRFFTRVAKSSEKKRKQNKNTKQKQAQGRRQGKHRLSFLIFSSDLQSNGQGETRVDIRTDKCTRNNYKWEIGSLHVQVR